MADGTKIEWCDATVNAVNGCSVVSPGCTNCYAMKLAGTRLRHHPSREGLTIATKAGPVWNGQVRLHEPALLQPLRWRRPRKIFWNAHGDLFHPSVPDEWVDRCFAVMALTPQHIHQVLTKRPERMRAWFERWPHGAGRFHWVAAEAAKIAPGEMGRPGPDAWVWQLQKRWPLPNVWIGTSIEDRDRLWRLDELRQTPAHVRFLSLEPLLEDLGEIDLTGIHLVIVGGESGRSARPMHPDWVRDLRDQCSEQGVPFFFKQWGEWAPGVNASSPVLRTEQTADWWNGKWAFSSITPKQAEELHCDDEPALYRLGKRQAGRHLDGVTHDGMPA